MALIHQLAVKASETTNLIELGQLLVEVCTIAMEGDIPTYKHPVVRLICHMISFSGDGDIPTDYYYKDVLQYCIDNADNEGEPEGEVPNEPSRQSS